MVDRAFSRIAAFGAAAMLVSPTCAWADMGLVQKTTPEGTIVYFDFDGIGYALIIVSNCQDGYIQDFLDFADMRGLFGDFESAGGTGLSKGENIKLVIERNSIDKAVYVGDTQGDLDSADFAGIPFIRAAYGFGQMNRPVPEIREFCELPEKAAEII